MPRVKLVVDHALLALVLGREPTPEACPLSFEVVDELLQRCRTAAEWVDAHPGVPPSSWPSWVVPRVALINTLSEQCERQIERV